MKWLEWEKDPKKESGSSEWKPILKYWLIVLSGAAIIIWIIKFFNGNGE